MKKFYRKNNLTKTSLLDINAQFYYLIKILRRFKYIRSADTVKQAYCTFADEISDKLRD